MSKLAKRVGLGLCSVIASCRRPGGIPILAYHSIDDSQSYLSTSRRHFEVEVETLVGLGYTGISHSQMVNQLHDGRLPRQPVVFTFDDGLRNFQEAAWPVLQKAGFGATLFVPTDFVGTSSTWYANHDLIPQPTLSWDDLKHLHSLGVDIQSHGCSHRKLTTLSDSELKEDLQASKELLSRKLQVEIDHFCYPYGDFDTHVKEAVQAAGFRTAVTTRCGRHLIDDDAYAMKRENLDMVTLEDEQIAEFVIRACVQGSFSAYIRAKEALRQWCGRSPD